MDQAEEPAPDQDEDLYAPWMLAAGSLVVAAGTLQTLGRWAGMLAERSAPLARLTRATMGDREGAERARFELRDEVLGLLRDMGDVASQETRRYVAEFERYTGTELVDEDRGPSRGHRVKR